MATERVVWYLWTDSLALAILNNSGQSDSGQSDCRLVTCTQKTCAKLVGTSLTCKRSCLDYGYSTLEIELCPCSAEILDKCLTASMRMLHLDFSITDNQREVIFNFIRRRGKSLSVAVLPYLFFCPSSSTDGT